MGPQVHGAPLHRLQEAAERHPGPPPAPPRQWWRWQPQQPAVAGAAAAVAGEFAARNIHDKLELAVRKKVCQQE